MDKNKNSILKKYENSRSKEFLPNPDLTLLIERFTELLGPVQQKITEPFVFPKYPVILIIGCPRTGSTLLTQILAQTGNFAYPTNFLARFAYAPSIGAMLQNMLFDPLFDFRGEFSDIQSQIQNHFKSTLGKTPGTLNVNEFFHFWRRFFPNYDPEYLNHEDLENVNISLMRKELAAIEYEFQKPFLSKGKMIQYNLKYFAEHMPELIIVHIKRNPRYVMQSILLARRSFYDNDDVWFSTKPKEYEWLSDLDPYSQIAGQVLFTEQAIDAELAQITPLRTLTFTYEDMCNDVQAIYDKLKICLKKNGYDLPQHVVEHKFTSGNQDKLPSHEIKKLLVAYKNMCNQFP